MPLPLKFMDWLALGWFFVWWIGYVRLARWYAKRVPSLVMRMTRLRTHWMTEVVTREVRIGDINILANLSNGSTFFASTTLLILGGLLALLGTTDKVAMVVMELPFTRQAAGTDRFWDIKILLLTGIFTFAFFKFTWSLRLYHFCSVMVGGSPPIEAPQERKDDFIQHASATAGLAADSFNNGLRAYYFGLAALMWFINPWAWMVATSWVVLILYLREFRSDALETLYRGI
jgi:uncharacterized membrane protein